MINFFKDKKVFITGHTGFKGSWLCLWLHLLGAKVYGYALNPPTDPSLYELCGIDNLVHSMHGDVRDGERLKKAMLAAEPDIIIHMAAQALVRKGYADPIKTYSTNIMGTVNVLEAVRQCKSVRAVVNVTSDKCYANKGCPIGYSETDKLGGSDPYSNSKACSELVTDAYRSSFLYLTSVRIATARAGNVIGGGDWAKNRLIPDCIRGFLKNKQVVIRKPWAIRPWQHVLEPLTGYLVLARGLMSGFGYDGAWNFGPDATSECTVKYIVDRLCAKMEKTTEILGRESALNEEMYLVLDSSKARQELGWRPRWNLDTALDKTVEWTKAYQRGEDMREVCFRQIREYEATGTE